MNINQAFKYLLDDWKDQKQDFKDKYKPYRSRHEKSKGMKMEEIISKRYYVGEEKKREMLLAAGYKVQPEVWEKPSVKPTKK